MQRPGVRFVFSHPARVLAFGLGYGLSPVAPGTVGTLLAFPLSAGLFRWAGDLWYLPGVALGFLVGVWACERTARDLGVSDYGGVVWDEVVAFTLVLYFIPDQPLRQALAFLLFRFFDIVKPPPAGHIDRHWHNGFGVMADDLVAAFYTLVALAVLERVLAAWP